MRFEIEYNGILLRRSGSSWGVGEAAPRTIRGVETKALVDPIWTTRLHTAMALFAGRIERRWKDQQSREIAALFLLASAAIGDASPSDLIRLYRRVRKLAKKGLARDSGIPARSLREIENEGRSPTTATLLKVIRAGGVRSW